MQTPGSARPSQTKRTERHRHEDVITAANNTETGDSVDGAAWTACEEHARESQAYDIPGGPDVHRSWESTPGFNNQHSTPRLDNQNGNERYPVEVGTASRWTSDYEIPRHQKKAASRAGALKDVLGRPMTGRGGGAHKVIGTPGRGDVDQSVFGKLMGKRVTILRKQRTTACSDSHGSNLGIANMVSPISPSTAAEVLFSLKDSCVHML